MNKIVKNFLRYYWSDLVEFALDIANLDDKEREAAILIGRRGMTIESAAEVANCSVNTMQTRWSKARKRLEKSWSGIEWIEILSSTVE